MRIKRSRQCPMIEFFRVAKLGYLDSQEWLSIELALSKGTIQAFNQP